MILYHGTNVDFETILSLTSQAESGPSLYSRTVIGT